MTRKGGMSARLPTVLGLTVLWVLLWGGLSPLLVVGGLLVAILVTQVFPFPAAAWHGRLRPWSLVRLISRFLVDLVVASLQVAWIAIRPQAPPKGAVIEVQLVTRSEFLLTMTGELISLVPGSLLIELDSAEGLIWLHLLDGSTPHKIERARTKALQQEHRVIAALGSHAELAACRAGGQS